jgi:hypothetical protein
LAISGALRKSRAAGSQTCHGSSLSRPFTANRDLVTMRDGLTALAGLIIILLVAALAGPAFVDWTQWRGEIDRRLGDAIGQPLTSSGNVSLQLLPHPQLALSGLEIAPPVSPGLKPGGPLLQIAHLDLSLSLPALIKGEIRVMSARADGAVLTLLHDDAGRLQLPVLDMPVAAKRASLEALSLGRAQIRLRSMTTGTLRTIGPLAAEITAQALTGPWKVEAEIAGQPLRIVTGAHDGQNGLPFKLVSETGARRLEGEGQLRFLAENGGMAPELTGQAVVTLKGEPPDDAGLAAAPTPSAPHPAAQMVLTARGGISGGKASFNAISIDLGEAGKLEGDGAWDLTGNVPMRLKLGSRRIAGEGVPPMAAFQDKWRSLAENLPPLDMALTFDQMAWRGEEMVDIAASLAVRGNQVQLTNGVAKSAGASLSLAGEASRDGSHGRFRIGVDAPSLYRAALALGRMGLAPESADVLSELGSLALSTDLVWQGEAIRIENLVAKSRAGTLMGRMEHLPAADSLILEARGFDLAGWAALRPLVQHLPGVMRPKARLGIDLKLADAHWGAGPKGSARLVATRDAGRWTVTQFDAGGFGGLTLKAAQGSASEAITIQLDAPDAGPVVGMAAVLLPEMFQPALASRGAQFSPLSLSLTWPGPGAAGWQARGRAGPGLMVALDGGIDAPGPAGVSGLGLNLTKARIEGDGRAILKLVDPRLVASGLGDGERAALELAMISKGGAAAEKSATLKLEGPALSARWDMLPGWESWIASGPFTARWQGASPTALSGNLRWEEGGFSLDDAKLLSTDASGRLLASGNLLIGRDGAIEGAVAVPVMDTAFFTGIGWGRPGSSLRFGEVPELPDVRISLSAGKVVSGPFVIAKDWQGQVALDPAALRIDDMRAVMAGGALTGSVRLGREGSLRALGWRLALAGADAGIVTGDRLLGRLDIKLDGGTSGETSQRLLAGLGGAGQVSVHEGRIPDMAPAALKAALEQQEVHESMAQAFVSVLGKGAWPLGSTAAPLTLSGGVLRLGRVDSLADGARLALSGTLDARSQTLDIVAELTPVLAPANRDEAIAKAAVAWRGPLDAPRRAIDLDGVRNVLAARELTRELERIAAFEADTRERALFARRLRSEREAKEREAREREAAIRAARVREEAESRARSGPMQILPVPVP